MNHFGRVYDIVLLGHQTVPSQSVPSQTVTNQGVTSSNSPADPEKHYTKI